MKHSRHVQYIFEQIYVIYGSIKRGTEEIFVSLVFALMNVYKVKSYCILENFVYKINFASTKILVLNKVMIWK